MTAELLILDDGTVRSIYTDALDFRALAEDLGASLEIRRASHVEPTSAGLWEADLSPAGGPLLGPFALRQEALDAEVAWLREHLQQHPGGAHAAGNPGGN